MNLKLSRTKTDLSAPKVKGTAGLQLLYGGFDFTDGAFTKAERTRRVLLTVLLVCAGLLVVLLIQGLSATLAARASTEVADTAQLSAAKTAGQIAKLDTADGYSASQLETHANARSAAMRAATAREIDMRRMMAAALAAAPNGVRVSLVDIQSASAAPPAPAAAKPSAAPAAPAAPAADPNNVGTMKVTGTAASFSDISAYRTALTQVKGVTSADATWTGGGSAWTINLTAQLGNEALNGRSGVAAKAGQ